MIFCSSSPNNWNANGSRKMLSSTEKWCFSCFVLEESILFLLTEEKFDHKFFFSLYLSIFMIQTLYITSNGTSGSVAQCTHLPALGQLPSTLRVWLCISPGCNCVGKERSWVWLPRTEHWIQVLLYFLSHYLLLQKFLWQTDVSKAWSSQQRFLLTESL